MFRSKKSKNQYGTFHISRLGYKKSVRFLITALIVVIFVSGAGILIFRGNKKPKVQAVVQNTVSVIPGWWYQQYFGKSVCDSDNCKSDADPDKDGLTNAQEFYYHTDPMSAHTVKDKLNDGQLVAQGFDPSKPGHMTFDQAVSQDNILGESLVMNKDIVKIVSDLTSTDNIQVPVIDNTTIKISQDNSKKSMIDYFNQFNLIISKYFPNSIANTISDTINSGNPSAIDDLTTRAAGALAELKQIKVPSDALTLHKEFLNMFQLLPSVINIPPKGSIESPTDQAGNLWYDQMRTYMYLMQQSNLEVKKLQVKYK